MGPSSQGRSLWMSAVATLLAASAVAGQGPRIIHGTVLDSRDQPIAMVSVTSAGAKAAISDDSGRFRLEITHHERVVFDLKRLGYTPSRFALAPGGDTAVSVLLLPTAQQLAAVDVKETAPKANSLAGFEERMRARQRAAGTGYFITLKEIEAMNPSRATETVQNVPTISVRRTDLDSYAIYGRAVGTGGDCLATVWVDGVQVGGAGKPMLDRRTRRVVPGVAQTEVDPYLIPSEIAGVEVYPRGMMAPPQFLPPGDPNASRCAVVAFWTKHAR